MIISNKYIVFEPQIINGDYRLHIVHSLALYLCLEIVFFENKISFPVYFDKWFDMKYDKWWIFIATFYMNGNKC